MPETCVDSVDSAAAPHLQNLGLPQPSDQRQRESTLESCAEEGEYEMSYFEVWKEWLLLFSKQECTKKKKRKKEFVSQRCSRTVPVQSTRAETKISSEKAFARMNEQLGLHLQVRDGLNKLPSIFTICFLLAYQRYRMLWEIRWIGNPNHADVVEYNWIDGMRASWS